MTLFADLILLTVYAVSVSSAWDLSPLSLDSATISHVTLYGSKAILTVLRQDVHQPYTLLEASWPDRPKPFFSYTKPYPSREPQGVGVCSSPQRTVCSDSDDFRLLFVLDAGWHALCPPKILVYDLITNKKVEQIELSSSGFNSQTHLSSLVVDGTSFISPKAYISEFEPGKLIVVDLHSQQWWIVALSQPFSTTQLALAGSSLFLASNATDTLLRMDLTALRTSRPLNSHPDALSKITDVEVEEVGLLLGPPTGLVADKQRLYYCIARDYVCVRWDTQLPLTAESHEVMLQSAELLGHVYQLFLDFRKQVWALTDVNNGTHCVLTSLRRPYLLYQYL